MLNYRQTMLSTIKIIHKTLHILSSNLRTTTTASIGSKVYRSVIKTPLPKPPVPQLSDTLAKYLEYARVIADGRANVDISTTELAVKQFEAEEGVALQDELIKIAENEHNWINRYWLPEMYHRVRLPVPINSSPAYLFPQQQFRNQSEQINYTSCLIRGICEYKDKIDRKAISTDYSSGRGDRVRMCMEQYDRLLSSYRQPSHIIDIHYYDATNHKMHNGNEHIIVMVNNQAFVVHTRCNGQLLSRSDIIYQLNEIIRIASNRCISSVIPIGAVSAGDRDVAAAFWNIANQVSTNSQSLEWIRSAIFVVCIDTNATTTTTVNTDDRECDIATRAMHLLHGYGSRNSGINRWYDATIQVIVGNDGTNGLCIEHSIAEGIVIINMIESVSKYIAENISKKLLVSSIDDEDQRRLMPKPLTWLIGADARMLIDKQINTFDRLTNDLQLRVLHFDEYGKEFIKSQHISPDGYVQLAMQLAYFSLHGHLVSTYESAAIRRFRLGRVDNIRAATMEALAWVKIMQNTQSTNQMKRKSFDRAVEKQAQVTYENITGYGIDNHICALNVLAREHVECGKLNAMPLIFTDPLHAQLMRFPLSTSQVSTSDPESFLCYGPVVIDGYGCSYNIQTTQIIFGISAFKSNPKTDADQFKTALKHSLLAMHKLLIDNSK